jgi:hypothetical protein
VPALQRHVAEEDSMTALTHDELAAMTVTTGIGRDVLEARLVTLTRALATQADIVSILTKNVTAVQDRCTKLFSENRAIRMTGSSEGVFLADTYKRAVAARAKYPGNAHRLAAVLEEAGEASRALHKGEGRARLYDECLDLAACAMRLALEGDAAFPGSGEGE